MWRAFSQVSLLQMPAHWANYLVVVWANLKGQYPPQKPVNLFPSLMEAASVNRIWRSSKQSEWESSGCLQGAWEEVKWPWQCAEVWKVFSPRNIPHRSTPHPTLQTCSVLGPMPTPLQAQRRHIQNCGRASSPLQECCSRSHLQNDTHHHYHLCREKVRDTYKNCFNFWESCP